MGKSTRIVARGSMLLTAVAVSAGLSAQASERPLLVERATVLPQGAIGIHGNVAYEIGREAGFPGPDGETGDYDNLRMGPVGVRGGLGDRFEVGGYLTANINSEDDDGAPDESGLEGLTGYGKLSLNDYFALTVGMTVAGSDDVGPYPNDGIDFFVNLPMQRPLGVGLVYGELGYTIQDNDVGGGYMNYGLGYALPVEDQLTLNAELVGEESNTGFRAGNSMSLVFGAGFHPEPNIDLMPYASVGLYDAAPDVAIGASFEVRM